MTAAVHARPSPPSGGTARRRRVGLLLVLAALLVVPRIHLLGVTSLYRYVWFALARAFGASVFDGARPGHRRAAARRADHLS